MPRGKKKTRKDLTRKEAFKTADFGGYLNVDLTSDERDNFALWAESKAVNVLQAMDELLELGIDFKFYKDWKEGTVICQMLMITEPDFKIWTISSFHGSYEDSMLLSLYKHFVLLDGDWHTAISGIGDKPFFG